MELRVFQVDAFAERPFEGNPAAVCVTQHALDDALMQSIATEMNLSETAFAVARGGTRYGLRWFTPACEVPLCGHATLATAHVLFDSLGLTSVQTLVFETLSGELRVSRRDGRLCMDFPADPPQPVAMPVGLQEAFPTVQIYEVLRGQRGMLLLVLESVEQVVRVRPNFDLLAALETEGGWRGTIISAPGGDGADFTSRFFAPNAGINEDPVTGSAHTVLAPFYAERLEKDTLQAWQASRRGGRLTVEMHGDRVHLLGRAVMVMDGMLRV
jgi:PhzF family phenazine biosynthesis protein